MRFKKVLTRADLAVIQARNLDFEDMKVMLQEVARLRSLVLYADQLQRMAGTLPGQQGDLLESVRRMLEGEPRRRHT